MNEEPVSRLGRKIRVLVLSPYRIIQESLKILISESQCMTVAGNFNLAELPIDAETFKNIETLVIYLTDQDSDYIEAISDVLAVASRLHIIVVASENDSNNQMRAIELGAVGIVDIEQNSRMLIEAIRQTNLGETWIKQNLLTNLLNNRPGKNTVPKSRDLMLASCLTSREKEVVQMIGRGLKNKEIAQMLFIKESTVRHHLSAIYGKLNVTDRLNLVIYAYQHNLIKDVSPDKENSFAGSYQLH